MGKEAIVLGCGVIGLTTALLLQQKLWKVTIVAQATPRNVQDDPHYTSPKAGAMWRSVAEEDDIALQTLEKKTYSVLSELARVTGTGITKTKIKLLQDVKREDWQPPWYAPHVSGFEILQDLPDGFAFGYEFDSFSINVPNYLGWLLERFESSGGIMEIGKVSGLTQLFREGVDLVVNCSGYGARFLGGVEDTKMYPVRGQSIWIRTSEITDIIVDDSTSLDQEIHPTFLPRDDGSCMIGVSFQTNKSDLEPDQALSKTILDACLNYHPYLKNNSGQLDILRTNVGLRPFREGGVRLDTEEHALPSGRKVKVLHNYGYGSYGYQTSWATCEKAYNLLDNPNAEESPVSMFLSKVQGLE